MTENKLFSHPGPKQLARFVKLKSNGQSPTISKIDTDDSSAPVVVTPNYQTVGVDDKSAFPWLGVHALQYRTRVMPLDIITNWLTRSKSILVKRFSHTLIRYHSFI